MPSAPDADENSPDQPDTQPGTATSSDKTPSLPDTSEAEEGTGRDVPEADQATTSAGEEAPFPPRGTLTLRALRWGGVLAIFVSAVIIYLLWPTGARLGWDPSTPRGSVGDRKSVV